MPYPLELTNCSIIESLSHGGAGIRQLDELDFAYGFGLTEKIVKGNGIKRCKKGQEAMRTAKRASGRDFLTAIVQIEPWLQRDKVMIHMLRSSCAGGAYVCALFCPAGNCQSTMRDFLPRRRVWHTSRMPFAALIARF